MDFVNSMIVIANVQREINAEYTLMQSQPT